MTEKSAHRTSRACLFLLGIITLLWSMPLHAQRFLETFGSPDPVGEEGNGVIETSKGDLVSAGVSNVSGVPEMLLSSTNAHGNLNWSFTYQFPSFTESGATDVKEFPNGDLVVVGWGRVSAGADPLGIVMRVDAAGSPLWGTSFWINLSNTTLQSVAITQYGNGSTTNPDDIIFAGYTFPYTPGPADALLGRMDGIGNMIWCQVYDHQISSSSSEDRLYGIDESRIKSPSGIIGDIIATGVVNDKAAGLDDKVLVMRVDASNGKYTSSSHGSAMYGDQGQETGYSIQELRSGKYVGDLVITGSTTSRPAPSSAIEAFLLQTTSEPCKNSSIRAASYFGDDGSADEWGLCVREITKVGTVGNIVVAGITKVGWLGGSDGFVQEFQEGTLIPTTPQYFYGDGGDDAIHSFAEVINAPTTPGYALTGVTDSPSLIDPANKRNLMLIKTDSKLESACGFKYTNVSDAPAPWFDKCIQPVEKDDVIVMNYYPTATKLGWKEYQVCYSPFKTAMPGNDPAGTSGSSAVTLASYPNPVRREDGITLEYSLVSPGTADIVITDALGRTMFQRRAERDAGRGAEQVSTAGWSAGTYLARISAAGTSVTARIVLLDK